MAPEEEDEDAEGEDPGTVVIFPNKFNNWREENY